MHNKQDLEKIFANDFGSPYFPILAECYMNEGDLVRAKQVCNIGLNHDKYNAIGKIILAKIAMIEEKPTIAEKWLKQAINIDAGNFLALRILIRIEFILNRKHQTILQYINMILRFLPNDMEANEWLKKISLKNIIKKNDVANKNITKKTIKTSPNPEKYEISHTMATFTMLDVLKKQKSYQQALFVLDALEFKKNDLPRIKKERKFILSLIKKHSSSKT